jgi:deoxyribodipyrimidine photo-lyase
MATVIYWFRNDLRIDDNPAFTQAHQCAQQVLPVFCHTALNTQGLATTRWGFERVGAHRQRFLNDSLHDLAASLQVQGSALVQLRGAPQHSLAAAVRAVNASHVVCEEIAAPHEQQEVHALRAAGVRVDTVWQSSLLESAQLPFASHDLPGVFTAFRHSVERAGLQPAKPLPTPKTWRPMLTAQAIAALHAQLAQALVNASKDRAQLSHAAGQDAAHSSFPYRAPAFSGGAQPALAHLQQYFQRGLAHSYKTTRNGLMGLDYSSKFSPWLAYGALSARTVFAALQQCEQAQGASDGSYWLWFELLWRDYFRFLHLKHGVQLYHVSGLSSLPELAHSSADFERWCLGTTGQPLVDAGMRELHATGYLSNRMRQLVASYLVHDLQCDWRAGAAWFESQLLDYDVYSNQGNWLYVAGRGTDPRTGRRFNLQKQTQDHDPQGHYRAAWGTV